MGIYSPEKLSLLLKTARGNRSINQYGRESGVDPGYISRLSRELVKVPPSAAVLARLASCARGGITTEDLMSAAGYIETPACSQRSGLWDQVIEEAVRYDISPETALAIIKDLGESLRKRSAD